MNIVNIYIKGLLLCKPLIFLEDLKTACRIIYQLIIEGVK